MFSTLRDSFEAIRKDQARVPISSEWPKGINTIDYAELTRYARELNELFSNGTFLGVTQVKHGSKLDSSITEMDAAVLHFRDGDRAMLQCLYFMTIGYPLVPCPAISYVSGAHRSLSYFETVASGLTGLRIHQIHCPYRFQPILAIDFKCAASSAMQNESYRLAIIASGSKRKLNTMLILDQADSVILANSHCINEEDATKFGAGKAFDPQPIKSVPDPAQTFEQFIDGFKGHEHTSLLKALLSLYEGIDAVQIQKMALESGVSCTTHVSKLENLQPFYETFISFIRKCTLGDPDENDEGAESVLETIYQRWAGGVMPYRHNREASECLENVMEIKQRLERIRDQCSNDPQLADRYAKVQERLLNLGHYKITLDTIMEWKKPSDYQLLETIRNELVIIDDLVGYRKRPKRKAPLYIVETREKVTKKGPSLKGIKFIRLDPENPDSPLIIAGKSAKTNEIVTLELAKPLDLWLHVKDVPGSHVLVRRHENDPGAIQAAANVAAYLSKASRQDKVPVCLTDISNVEKQPQAELGAVLIRNFKIITGFPNQGKDLVAIHQAGRKE
ncbi:NFACT [Babesia duncani]|uniref:NFACT n=1 Tax=Babesia duncani TaxID=323732 RepID=A0AAD9UQI4_9APIC|nr:NFACT [Babesia duncani]